MGNAQPSVQACGADAECCAVTQNKVEEKMPIIRSNFVLNSPPDLMLGGNMKAQFPTDISAPSRAVVERTSATVYEAADAIASAYYRMLLLGHVELLEFLNLSDQRTGRQQAAFATALRRFIEYHDRPECLTPVLNAVAVQDCGLGLEPRHHIILVKLLTAALSEVLGPLVTKPIAEAWSEALQYFAGLFVKREEDLYRQAKARNGGWRGFRRFFVARRRQEADDIVTFTLKPMDTSGVYIDFTPGQFVSVKCDPDGDGFTAPRHYIVTSPPGMPHIEISVKRVIGGKVSTFLHDRATQGQILYVSPPFGNFTVPAPLGRKRPSLVLLSAGIGCIPMLAFAQAAAAQQVQLFYHVARDEDSHPFLAKFQERLPQMICRTHYTRSAGRRPAPDLASRLASLVCSEAEWFICGPTEFMADAIRSLLESGIDQRRIHFEQFGPQLCPIGVPDVDKHDMASIPITPAASVAPPAIVLGGGLSASVSPPSKVACMAEGELLAPNGSPKPHYVSPGKELTEDVLPPAPAGPGDTETTSPRPSPPFPSMPQDF
eukprot:TRINITY_DN31526_c0_g1_i2.p1 TRINITY_DN31526_c0_g1~~TRINITY_DN31526_c0_g1_i2.p1  ORF type:complete len:546 (+),score=107.47 TRINITY_DN31526_c0_g1_i2:135-1772(+)